MIIRCVNWKLPPAYGVAQVAVALIFALEHITGGSSWTNALIGSSVGSLLFGMAAIASRGLALPIGVHAAWNFGDWLRGGKDAVGIWKPAVDEGYADSVQTVGMVSYFVLFLLTTLCFWHWRRISLRSGDSTNEHATRPASPPAGMRG
jgi:membrane protease YdiL (CAAX protease family)